MDNQNPQTVSSQTPLPQQPQSVVSQSPPSTGPSKTFLFAIVFVLLAGASAAAYFLGMQNSRLTAKPVVSIAVVVTPTPTVDPTANWQTYTDTKQMYSVKYPSAWTVFPNTIGGILSAYKGTIINSASKLEPHGETLAEDGQAGIAINVIGIDKSPNETLVQYQTRHLNILGPTASYYTPGILNGLSILKHIRTNDESGAGQPSYVLSNNNIVYEINVSVKNTSYAQVVDQIFSTFTFTN